MNAHIKGLSSIVQYLNNPLPSEKSLNNHYHICFLGITPFFIRKVKPKIMFLYSEIVFTISMLGFAVFALLVKEYPGLINLDFFSLDSYGLDDYMYDCNISWNPTSHTDITGWIIPYRNKVTNHVSSLGRLQWFAG